jgi:uncharacterized protein (TIGR02452 family)
VNAGEYVAPSGRQVSIAAFVDAARGGTVEYGPADPLPSLTWDGRGSMRVEVVNETTLAAAHRLFEAGHEPAALNFASATTAGGGFLDGARAQEEYLARSSALYACLRGCRMYAHHRGRQDPFYDDFVIYSPDVPVFRDDDGELLDEPWRCTILTSPAVHAHGVRRYVPPRVGDIEPVMRRRIDRVLALAAGHQRPAIVLGAWGCGAFGNDTDMIARLFHESLQGPFARAFSVVSFAVTDWSPDRRFIGPFEERFGLLALGT